MYETNGCNIIVSRYHGNIRIEKPCEICINKQTCILNIHDFNNANIACNQFHISSSYCIPTCANCINSTSRENMEFLGYCNQGSGTIYRYCNPNSICLGFPCFKPLYKS